MKPTIRIDDQTRTAIKADGTRIPVRDSKHSALIQPNDEDIKNGIPGDHARCMYCLACRRQFNSELVWVTRTLAYVELKDKGKSVLNRFILTNPAKGNVAEFDTGSGKIKPDAVIFAAPRGTRTLDAIRRHESRRRAKANSKGKAYVKGQQPKSDRKQIKHFGETLRDKATGKFQFHPVG